MTVAYICVICSLEDSCFIGNHSTKIDLMEIYLTFSILVILTIDFDFLCLPPFFLIKQSFKKINFLLNSFFSILTNKLYFNRD